jgi:hypothetical protein
VAANFSIAVVGVVISMVVSSDSWLHSRLQGSGQVGKFGVALTKLFALGDLTAQLGMQL